MKNLHNSCVIRCMDHLWFHKTILLPQLPISRSPSIKSMNTTISEEEEEEEKESVFLISSSETDSSSTLSPVINLQCKLEQHTYPNEEDADGSSSSSSGNHRKTPRNLLRCNDEKRGGAERSMCCNEKKSGRGLVQRSMSLDRSSLWDLELEEVKGFMDLGFRFEKDHLCPELMSVLPGLQRRFSNSSSIECDDDDDDDVADDEQQKQNMSKLIEEEVEIMRPYLSEAWLIRRPDSPLLNLRMPRSVSNPADMKKHIKNWARTVASEILHD